MDITVSRSRIERQYPEIVKNKFVRGGFGRVSDRMKHSTMTQTDESSFKETLSIPESSKLVKTVDQGLSPFLTRYSALCTPPYRKKRDEDPISSFAATSVVAATPLFPRPSILHANTSQSDRRNDTPQYSFEIVVAIDFGTAYSGYAYSFTREPEIVHIMRKWEGDDPGMINQKTPTILLLTPDKKFHSFGISARDFYHDLDPSESKKWYYFDKFKMILHRNKEIGRFTLVKAANGSSLIAMNIFSITLKYFKDHALRELADATGRERVSLNEIRWVITVPAIWRQRAKGFMREAAYEAGIASPDNPDALFIALEPEAASIHCRKLRMNQLVPDPSSAPSDKDSDAVSVCSDFVLEESTSGEC